MCLRNKVYTLANFKKRKEKATQRSPRWVLFLKKIFCLFIHEREAGRDTGRERSKFHAGSLM